MEIVYSYAESTLLPKTFEINDDGYVYLRKNFKRKEVNGILYWSYDEALLTKKKFSEYISILTAQNAINSQNDSKHIASLMVEQENNNSNQLVVMEAIADLYEMILQM